MHKTSHLVVKICSLSHLFSAYTTHSPTELWSLKCSAIKQSYYNTKIESFDCLSCLWWLCLRGILPKSTTFPLGWKWLWENKKKKKTEEVKVGESVKSWWKTQQTTLEKNEKCGETINNGEPGALSVLSLIKYHPLKNNSFTPQPGSHLAYTPTRIHTTSKQMCTHTHMLKHTDKYTAESKETSQHINRTSPPSLWDSLLISGSLLLHCHPASNDNNCIDNIKAHGERRRLVDGDRAASK